MDTFPGPASPGPYSGVDQTQAWTVTQTVPRRRLLPVPVVRSGYTLVCFPRHHLAWKRGFREREGERQGRHPQQTVSLSKNSCWFLSFSDEAIRSSAPPGAHTELPSYC